MLKDLMENVFDDKESKYKNTKLWEESTFNWLGLRLIIMH